MIMGSCKHGYDDRKKKAGKWFKFGEIYIRLSLHAGNYVYLHRNSEKVFLPAIFCTKTQAWNERKSCFDIGITFRLKKHTCFHRLMSTAKHSLVKKKQNNAMDRSKTTNNTSFYRWESKSSENTSNCPNLNLPSTNSPPFFYHPKRSANKYKDKYKM